MTPLPGIGSLPKDRAPNLFRYSPNCLTDWPGAGRNPHKHRYWQRRWFFSGRARATLEAEGPQNKHNSLDRLYKPTTLLFTAAATMNPIWLMSCLLTSPHCLAQQNTFVSRWQSGQTPAAVSIWFEYCSNGPNLSERSCYRCVACTGPDKKYNRDLKSKSRDGIGQKLNVTSTEIITMDYNTK
jgi:hypothetical protein